MTNAKIIGNGKFNRLVEKAAENMWQLDNFILNLPADKERYMRKVVQGGLDKLALLEESKA